MRFKTALVSGLLLAAAVPALATPPAEKGEAELAKIVDGRVAGEPVRCIQLRDIRSSRIVDDTAIVYEVGSTLYVNKPRSGARSLDKWDVLVTDVRSSQLCSIDIVRLYDSTSWFETGFVGLGEFVPYKKVATKD